MTVINLINVSTITPTTVAGAITTSRAAIIDVAADKVAKVNSLIIANIDGTNAADVTVEVSVDNGSNYVAIASTISVPADASPAVPATPVGGSGASNPSVPINPPFLLTIISYL